MIFDLFVNRKSFNRKSNKKESCRSGRSGQTRNLLYPSGYRGFESLALRIKATISIFGWSKDKPHNFRCT